MNDKKYTPQKCGFSKNFCGTYICKPARVTCRIPCELQKLKEIFIKEDCESNEKKTIAEE